MPPPSPATRPRRASTSCARCWTPTRASRSHDVAERFSVNPRTALRYIQALQRAGEPLYEEMSGKRKVWRRLSPSARRQTITLTTAQMVALFLSRRVFDFLAGTGFKEDLDDVFAKLAMQDIADEKSRMRVLINLLTDGVMATDSQKRVVLANPAFLRMTGCREVQAVGCPVSEVIRYEPLELLIDRALAISGDELVELTEEICCEAEAGQPGPILQARCIPYIDRAGRNVGTITVLHDITALKRMDQIKSEFVSMVSHEIRSPLNSVLAQMQDNPGRPGRRGHHQGNRKS